MVNRDVRAEGISRILSERLGVPTESIRLARRKAVEHQSNELFEAFIGERHLLVKEFLNDNGIERAQHEFEALQRLGGLDVAPSPLLHLEPSDDHGPVVVYDFVEGQTWGRAVPNQLQLEALADAYLTLRRVPIHSLWPAHSISVADRVARFRERLDRHLEWTKSEYPAGQYAAEACVSALEKCAPSIRLLEGIKPEPGLCRGDPRFANIVEHPNGRLYFIDWEDCGLRDPAGEIADLMIHPNEEDLLSEHQWTPFLQRYANAVASSDPNLGDRVHLYVPVFCFFWLTSVMSANELARSSGLAGIRSMNGMTVNQRLRRYLARAQAWPEATFDSLLVRLEGRDFFPEAVPLSEAHDPGR